MQLHTTIAPDHPRAKIGLKPYVGTPVVYTAEYQHISYEYPDGNPMRNPKVCMRDIKLANGVLLTSHGWMMATAFADVALLRGAKYILTAVVEGYLKDGLLDYQLRQVRHAEFFDADVEDYFLRHGLPENNPVEGTHDGYRVDCNEAQHPDQH
jgi:hypothetical protein